MKSKQPFAVAIILAAAVAAQAASPLPSHATVLGIQGTEFTLNGEPTFLLGFSYYGALSAPEAAVRQDLDDAQRLGFNWLRVWATWSAFDHDVSAVGADGAPREPFLGRLKWLVAECDRRGLVVEPNSTHPFPPAGEQPPAMVLQNRRLKASSERRASLALGSDLA
jgi:hypothetical protein